MSETKLGNQNVISRLKWILSGQTFSFGLGYVSFLGGRLVRDLFLARILGSGAFGSWAALNILRQYGNYSDLGMMNGLARELPRIKSQSDEASKLATQAVVATCFGTVLALLWVAISRPQDLSVEGITPTAIILMVAFICFEKAYKYYNAIFLGLNEVKKAGLWLTALSLLDLTLAALGAWWGGVEGLLVGTLIAVALTAIAMSFQNPLRFTGAISWPLMRMLFFSSLILMGFGLLNIALHNFDRTLFLFLNGPDEVLGSYHAASLLALSVSVVPFILSSVANPRIYALDQSSDPEFNQILKKLGQAAYVLASAGALFAALVGPFVLKKFFPLQVHAPQIVRFLILGELFFAGAMIMDSILLVKGKGLQLLFLKFALIFLVTGSAAFYLHQFAQLKSVALAVQLSKAMAIAHMLCFLASYSYGFISTARDQRWGLFKNSVFGLGLFFASGIFILFLAEKGL